MTRTRACLVDVYETLLRYEFDDRRHELAALAGADAAAYHAEYVRHRPELDCGLLPVAEVHARALRACGIEPSPELIGRLVRAQRQLMRDCCPLYDDSVPFLKRVAQRGVKIALVSNCAETTRALLEELNLIGLADQVILSCETGFAKPSPEIYLRALDALGAAPADAVMIDDQAAYCAGAAAVGVRAIRIVRGDLDADAPPAPGFPVVRSLSDVIPLL